MKKIIMMAAILTGVWSAGMAEKKTLGHDDFDRWEKVSNNAVSSDGKWASFSINPQEGDGKLYFRSVTGSKEIVIDRGYSPRFSANGKWAFALIKPFYQATRQAKIDKKKDFDLPQDSLAIINLTTGSVEKIGRVISYRTPSDGGECVAWLSCDTALIKPKQLKDKKGGRPMVVRNLAKGISRIVNRVSDYVFAKKGNRLAFNLVKEGKDTLATSGTAVIDMNENTLVLIDRDKAFFGKPVFDEAGDRLAFVASNDSVKTGTKKGFVYISDLRKQNHDPREIKIDVKKDLFVNQYSEPEFSYDGRRLIVGVAPEVAPDDTTIVSFETAKLDIWRWDAPLTPPQENLMVSELRKKTYPVAVDLSTGGEVLITDNILCHVITPDRWDGDWALIADNSEYAVHSQWNYDHPVRLYLKNIANGEEKEVGIAPRGSFGLSPADKYVYWFADRSYHTYEIATGTHRVIGKDVDAILWNQEEDTPGVERSPYGMMGWLENDSRILVYDRYDVWSLDPQGTAKSVNVTLGEGRKKDLQMRYVKTNQEQRFLRDGEKVLYSLFDFKTKENGLATGVLSQKGSLPKVDILGEYSVTQVRKAKDADVYSWCQGNFNTSPNIYISQGLVASKTKKVSDSNPQMAEYKWGTANLFKWYAYDGKPSEGVLYLPEDFDSTKEYPMIVYFYETYSEDLYKHFDMEPSWSWINFPFYVSRGYVVFVPDIHYNAGIPGENCYNYVCSGVEQLCKKYPNIDKKRIGIDGQSWGGYQTAYLVTRTDMFACAGSGAPVSNMTSAYGGIRWGTGNSRQAQYEAGQSRIGRSFFDAPELYIANSPVFHADRIETPLLIIANDDDGAVPWYQGIEMFMALRRLEKPVWMLTYNGEAHNLKERRNRKDLTKRLQQFFDHYLKGDPMPEWMKNGIPAVRKGQEFGF